MEECNKQHTQHIILLEKQVHLSLEPTAMSFARFLFDSIHIHLNFCIFIALSVLKIHLVRRLQKMNMYWRLTMCQLMGNLHILGTEV